MILTAIIITNEASTKNSFYVGVTYGGNTVEGAKLLIDKVKNYTNLFILDSGDLQRNTAAINEIGDYAIACGLNFATYFGKEMSYQLGALWANSAKQRWGDHFIGVYAYDEPGGKFLENYVGTPSGILKLDTGGINVYDNDKTTTYYSNGTIQITHYFVDTITTYYPEGAVTILENQEVLYTATNGSAQIAQVEPLNAVLDRNPIKTYDDAAQIYKNYINEYVHAYTNRSYNIFTADFVWYWWDLQNGYDMVLAELGWNNSITQEIGLVRGAANLQSKDWGTIITWTYSQWPYLASGEEIYAQMRLSYECGANYVILFNYAAELMDKTYGVLQEEHFSALERFWVEVVENDRVVQGSVRAEAVLVLPRNYGWGMRNSKDIIWGIWDANDTSQQIWTQVQNKLSQYGSKLDIAYEDSLFPTNRYNHIYYWNQTD
jgi:hypothetical protein